MGTSNPHIEGRTTSRQRALIAAALQTHAAVESSASLYLADACAVLLDRGSSDDARAVLAHLLDRQAVEQTWTALFGAAAPAIRSANGDSPTYLQVIEASELPDWATYGLWSEPGGTGRRLFGRELLNLRTAAGATSPHFRVLALAVERARPTVAIEVSESGTPVILDRDNARHVLTAFAEAVKITVRHRKLGRRR
jgi:hypothetical protein